MKDPKIPLYLMTRTPQLNERVHVTNEHSHFYKQWGTVKTINATLDLYEVAFDETGLTAWFCRLEIAWDHGH